MAEKILRFVKVALLIAGLTLIVISDLRSRNKKLRVYPTQAELESVLPGASVKNRQARPVPHYPGKIEVDGQSKKAAALLTAELPPKLKGFTDEINILFAVDEDGKILGLRVISSRETPYYFRMVRNSGFLDKIIGNNFDRLGGLKAVSGASISSKAILDDIRTSAGLAMKEIFHREIPQAQSTSVISLYLQPRIIALAVVLLLGFSLSFFKSVRTPKWVIFGLSVAVIGFWLKTPFSLPHIFQIASLQVPLSSNPYLVLLGGFVILTTIFSGPLWCAYLCPYAGLQELAGKLGKKQRWRPSLKTIKAGRELRWLILFAALALYFSFGVRSAAEIEPFFHLFSNKLTAIGLVLVAVTLVGGFFIPRFWCRFFCPTGACLILLSSHRKFFKRVANGVEASRIDSGDN